MEIKDDKTLSDLEILEYLTVSHVTKSTMFREITDNLENSRKEVNMLLKDLKKKKERKKEILEQITLNM